jgi:Tfp pilus assembly protein PilV
MPRHPKCFTRRGLLLVEAILCAVVIAVGLAAVTRGLSSQLSTARAIEDRDRMMALARNALAEQQRLLWSGASALADSGEAFDEPNDDYEWEVKASPLETAGEGMVGVSRVEVSVKRKQDGGPTVRLWTVWPANKVPPEWL